MEDDQGRSSAGHGDGYSWRVTSSEEMLAHGLALPSDLAEEMATVLESGQGPVEIAIITAVDEPSGRLLDNDACGSALYVPSWGRIGIAWGGDADWADVTSLAEGIRIHQEDSELCLGW
jgi:hypothetical protein